ncbi:UNKNOWN [Stylonychia lemnae]|uniref:Uncharacterized protein n=1 Tax=Stylonychia lemnae TaxID=5949 RepID=A0A078B8X7_STYLE|nr:UNKNOWN [Stylonychia lemnae]|eukprot:CDW90864.1 UNKNOWN [Stylonychia lemnae]
MNLVNIFAVLMVLLVAQIQCQLFASIDKIAVPKVSISQTIKKDITQFLQAKKILREGGWL